MHNDTPCLHCAIRDAIAAHFDELGHSDSDRVIIQLDVALDALKDVLAELLAGVPDHDQRTRILARFLDGVVRRVNDILEHDEQPTLLMTH